MIDLLPQTHLTLRAGGYVTWPARHAEASILGFEDGVVMGFVCVFADPDALLSNWRSIERALLTQYSPRLLQAGDKAWNVCTAFLASGVATVEQRREIRWIEEDLDRTRKIAAAGLETTDDLLAALAPLLPIKAKPIMELEAIADRLARRIENIAPGLSGEILELSVDAAIIARRLGMQP